MNFDFLTILFLFVVLTGSILLLEVLYLAKRRKLIAGQKTVAGKPWLVRFAASFFPIFLFVLLLRAFLVQPYRVPTGSLEPTIMPGDFIAVNMFRYGLRLPLFHNKIIGIDEPKVGDIMLFRWPTNPHILLIKRVIGTPGDHVSYIGKKLYINGKEAKQKIIGKAMDYNAMGKSWSVERVQETINNTIHDIYLNPTRVGNDFIDLVVPKGDYFVMGDNRDDSNDSRFWGFVPENNIVGKAFGIWLSWNQHKKWFRWNRVGLKL